MTIPAYVAAVAARPTMLMLLMLTMISMPFIEPFAYSPSFAMLRIRASLSRSTNIRDACSSSGWRAARCSALPPGRTIASSANANGRDGSGDDGWGHEGLRTTVTEEVTGIDASVTATPPPLPPSDRMSKSLELGRLRDDRGRATRRVDASSYGSGGGNMDDGGGGGKDLFIPIVTLISVMGFTGLYGYEMLRLYSRGELYLPW